MALILCVDSHTEIFFVLKWGKTVSNLSFYRFWYTKLDLWMSKNFINDMSFSLYLSKKKFSIHCTYEGKSNASYYKWLVWNFCIKISGCSQQLRIDSFSSFLGSKYVSVFVIQNTVEMWLKLEYTMNEYHICGKIWQ